MRFHRKMGGVTQHSRSDMGIPAGRSARAAASFLILSVLALSAGSASAETPAPAKPPAIAPASTAVTLYAPSLAPLEAMGADIDQTSVSGISSGGAMAVQFHVAHSSIMVGAGIIAGVGYDCADSSLPYEIERVARGISACMPGYVSAAFAETKMAEAWAADAIDDPFRYLPGQKIWLFHGYNDGSVRRGAMDAVAAFYQQVAGAENVFYKNDNPAAHAVVTNDWGGPCPRPDADRFTNCNYDSAGLLLEHIYGTLVQPGGAPPTGEMIGFDQAEFVSVTDPASVGLGPEGFVYVPQACGDLSCRVHVVFHGCQQSASAIGDVFYKHAGYNAWADENRLIILYPQAVATNKFGNTPFNPNGCWDWWGYAAPEAHRRDFARKAGYQIAAVKGMLDRLSDGPLNLGPPDIFGTPVGLTVRDVTATSVKLTWQQNRAASGVEVFRAISSGGPYDKVTAAPVAGSSFVDRQRLPETTYFYKAIALDAATGDPSPETASVQATTDAVAPDCDPFEANNVQHVAERRAVTNLIRTWAMGTREPMGWYSTDETTHLIRKGVDFYVEYCP